MIYATIPKMGRTVTRAIRRTRLKPIARGEFFI
jgi:hypothetical protein